MPKFLHLSSFLWTRFQIFRVRMAWQKEVEPVSGTITANVTQHWPPCPIIQHVHPGVKTRHSTEFLWERRVPMNIIFFLWMVTPCKLRAGVANALFIFNTYHFELLTLGRFHAVNAFKNQRRKIGVICWSKGSNGKRGAIRSAEEGSRGFTRRSYVSKHQKRRSKRVVLEKQNTFWNLFY